MRIGNYELNLQKSVETRSQTWSVSDPAFAEWLQMMGYGFGEVSETRAMGLTAYYRAVSLISGTIAGLPLKTYKQLPEGGKERVNSFLDTPAGPYPLSTFAWKELVMLHLLNCGEAFLLHIYNNGGGLIGLWPIHPSAVDVEWAGYDKKFTVNLANGSKKEYNTAEMTQIMGLTNDGLRGMAPLTLFRNTIKLGIAGETAATRTFANGMLIAGLVTTDGDIEEEEAKAIKSGLANKLQGVENAGDIAFVNRSLKFTPWQMSNEDAQFLESREFQITEFARMFGIPPHLLGQTEKQTSWGTGVAEQNLGLARYTLMGWTSRIEEALSELVMKSRFVEFDYSGLLQGSPADEIKLLIDQVKSGLLTVDEARAIQNRPPLTEAQKPEPPTPDDGQGGEP